jgi:hypothetical protein
VFCAVQGHICAADAIISGKEAAALLRSWFLTSLARGHREVVAQAPEADLAMPMGLTKSEQQDFLRWASDAQFLDWALSASGAQRIATELKTLRAAAATRAIAGISSTQEGKEGLLRGISAAIKTDPTLAIQLRALLEARK